jgi:hypothetical protein
VGDSSDKLKYAERLRSGDGIPQDLAEAERYTKLAADVGDSSDKLRYAEGLLAGGSTEPRSAGQKSSLTIEIERHRELASKLEPRLVFHGDGHRTDLALPLRPLKVYDTAGCKAKLYFETNALFAKSGRGLTERILHSEIREAQLIPQIGHERIYLQLALDTVSGPRIFYFLPRAHADALRKILGSLGEPKS